ncbi:MAG: protein SCO1/2 [Planctomycetota bacterium]|jgi:protein SCO1/2
MGKYCNIILVGAVLFMLSGCGQESVREVIPKIELRPFADLGGDFELLDQEGIEFSLGDVRGRAALLFFGYTYCPDFCPTTLSRIVRVKELLGVGTDSLEVIFISVDPQRDSPAMLRSYLEYFPIAVRGLTGSRAAIDSVVVAYAAEYEIGAVGADKQYAVDHSTYIYLLDAQGRVRHLFAHDDRPEDIAAVLRVLWTGRGVEVERTLAGDALLAARDLGTYGCGALGPGLDEDYRFWRSRDVDTSQVPSTQRLQPPFRYGLDH